MAFTYTNSLEGVTPSGTTVTAANSGGSSGTAFSTSEIQTVAGGTLASDSTQAAHGTLSLKLATGATAGNSTVGWDGFTVTGSTAWYRIYAYFTANPAVSYRLCSASPASGTCFSLAINTAGTLRVNDSTGSQILVTTNAIPLNAWFRIEGYGVFSATVGQLEVKLFDTMDGTVPTETRTSSAAQNTSTVLTKFYFGNSGGTTANVVAHWYDDVGLTDQGYLGPSVLPAVVPAYIRSKMPLPQAVVTAATR